MPEGATSTATTVADRTRQQGQTRPLLAQPGPDGPVKPRRHAAASRPRPQPPVPPSPSSTSKEARRRAESSQPALIQMGPKWAQIWAERAPPATSTTTQPRSQRPRRRTEGHPLAGLSPPSQAAAAEPHRRRREVPLHPLRARGKADPPPPAPRGRPGRPRRRRRQGRKVERRPGGGRRLGFARRPREGRASERSVFSTPATSPEAKCLH
jgi:hypothetical protein